MDKKKYEWEANREKVGKGLEKRKNYKKMRIKRRDKLIKGKATKEPPMSVFVLKLM